MLRLGLKNSSLHGKCESDVFLPYQACFSKSCTAKLNVQKRRVSLTRAHFAQRLYCWMLGCLFNEANNVLIRSNIVILQPWIRCVCDVLTQRGIFALWGWRRIVLFIPYVCLLIKYIFPLLLVFNSRHIWRTSHVAFRGAFFCLQCVHGILTWFDPFCQASLNIFHSCCLWIGF